MVIQKTADFQYESNEPTLDPTPPASPPKPPIGCTIPQTDGATKFSL